MWGLDCSSGLLATPRSSKTTAAPTGRVLRSHRNKQKQKDLESGSSSTPKISSFFQVRKRASPSKNEKSVDVETERVCKRPRRNVSIRHLKFKSPESQYFASPSVSPIVPVTDSEEELSFVHPKISDSPPTELGIFECIPTHVLHQFLQNMSVSRLLDFSVMSRAWSDRVSAYLRGKTCLDRFISDSSAYISEPPKPSTYYTPADPFYTFGALMKSTTVCQTTPLRIAAAVRFCEHTKSAVTDKQGWGRFFNTVCEKWAFSECAKLLDAMILCFDLRSKLDLVLSENYSQGDRPEVEMEIRSSLRGLFVDPVEARNDPVTVHKEVGFWHSCLLRSICQTPFEQARIFLIMYAPTMRPEDEIERIDYRTLVDGVVSSWNEAEILLKPLSSALYSLLQTKKLRAPDFSWSENELFNLTEEITTFPEPWAFDNFVVLHMHWTCLVPISICARIRHGYAEEAGNMVNSMKTMLFRWQKHVVNVMRLPLTASMTRLSRHQKQELLDSICAAHARQCTDYQLLGPDSAGDLLVELQSQFAIKGLLSELQAMCRS